MLSLAHQIGVKSIETMSRIGIVVRLSSSPSNIVHDFVFAFAGNLNENTIYIFI